MSVTNSSYTVMATTTDMLVRMNTPTDVQDMRKFSVENNVKYFYNRP